MHRYSIFIILLLILVSCGKTSDEVIVDAILNANMELSSGYCQNAITTLESVGRQNENASYLKTLASAYACRAGYNAVNFFTSDVTNTVSNSSLDGTATYATSLASYQNPLTLDSKFQDLQTAINILLYAGGISSSTEPTRAQRLKYFSTSEVNDIDSQLLFMQLVQMGVFYKIYGNASAAGVKGAGSAFTNVCFSSYGNTPADNLPPALGGGGSPPYYAVRFLLSSMPGNCKVVTDGSAQTKDNGTLSATERKRRLCEGVVLVNGLIASIANVAGSLTGNAGTTATAATAILTASQTALTTAYPTIGIVKSTINQSICESDQDVPVAELESFYAIMVEGLFR